MIDFQSINIFECKDFSILTSISREQGTAGYTALGVLCTYLGDLTQAAK